jgi:RimJ/RimL family protein N-acetyltransferase
MIDVRSYSAEEILKNGTAVRIRCVRADDKNRIREAFRNLETESIYKRFFQYKKALTDEELKAATEIDFENEVALMVTRKSQLPFSIEEAPCSRQRTSLVRTGFFTIGEKETETIIGAGRYVAFDSAGAQRGAEVAFTVEEDYQGLGIASVTLRHLAGIAKDKGIAQFHAEVLRENRGMLAVFKRSGFPMKQAYDEGVVHVTLSLSGELSDE